MSDTSEFTPKATIVARLEDRIDRLENRIDVILEAKGGLETEVEALKIALTRIERKAAPLVDPGEIPPWAQSIQYVVQTSTRDGKHAGGRKT